MSNALCTDMYFSALLILQFFSFNSWSNGHKNREKTVKEEEKNR